MDKDSSFRNLDKLYWIRPHPLLKHQEGCEYALSLDAEFVYERRKDETGAYHYRRAEWARIATTMEWLYIPEEFWTQVTEEGKEVDPQKVDGTR